MSNLHEKLTSGIKDAMKSKDAVRLQTLRLISAELVVFEKENPSKNVLNDENIVKILQKERKKRLETFEFCTNKGLKEAAEKERVEISIIDEFLPQMLEAHEIQAFTEKFFVEFAPVTVKKTGEYMNSLAEFAKSQGKIFDRKEAAKIFNTLLIK